MACFIRLALLTLLLVVTCSPSLAISVVYTHTSGFDGDGFLWDQYPEGGLNDLDDGYSFYTPDNVAYYNGTGNTTYFDSNYQAAGNSSVIDGDAWWGNPNSSGYSVEFEFDSSSEPVTLFSFDFAWAFTGQDAPDYLAIQVFDYDGDGSTYYEAYTYVPLDEVFNAGSVFGGFDGRAGHIEIYADQLIDQYTEASLNRIDRLAIELSDAAFHGSPVEIAIDNVGVNASLGPGDSDIAPLATAISSNFLRGTNDFTVGYEVTNSGGDPTTFSVSIEPTSSSEFQAASPLPTAVPVAAGTTAYTGTIATLGKNELSGEYLLESTVSNDQNFTDPDETTPYTLSLYDPVALSDNSSSTVQIDTSPILSISNAAAGPHAGALRATAEVTGITTTDGFSIAGYEVGTQVDPSQTQYASVSFNTYGKLSGNYTGSVEVALEMTTPAGYLNYATPVPSISWDVAYNLQDVTSNTVTYAANQSYNQSIAINSATSATSLVGGTSPVAQNVSLTEVDNTGINGVVLSDPASLDFGSTSGLYVLQIAYDPANLAGLLPSDLQILELPTSSSLWQLAIDNNSDGGAGGTMAYVGAFDDFLASSGGTLDAGDLSHFGYDTATNTAWVVLDHEGPFALGTLIGIEGDYNADGLVDLADYAVWRNHLGSSTALPNDPHGGTIGVAQYTTWKNNFGTVLASSLTSQTNAVPEPGTIGLMLLMMAAAASRKPRQPLRCNTTI